MMDDIGLMEQILVIHFNLHNIDRRGELDDIYLMHDEAFLHVSQRVCIMESFSNCLGMHTSNNGGYLTFGRGKSTWI